MLILKAFKFELMPNGAQVRKMKQFCGCSRFVFNRALDYQNKQYEADKSFKFSYAKITALLPEWKRELTWLKDCHSQVLQQALKDLENSFKKLSSLNVRTFQNSNAREKRQFPLSARLQIGTTK